MRSLIPKTSKSTEGSTGLTTIDTNLHGFNRPINDGRFRIDNNPAENVSRQPTLGRKYFLFCWNHDAAIRVAIVYTLVDSCKALDVDPREWMEDVLVRVPGNENNREALRKLLPDK